MKNRGNVLVSVVAVLAGVMFAFVLGYSWDTLTNPQQLVTELRNLPARLSFAVSDPATVKGLPTIQTYSDALSEIEKRHYRKVDRKEITYAAIAGMMSAVDDPYTRFMTPKMWEAMNRDTRGQYVGVGATLDPHNLGAKIKRPLPNSPCTAAGIRANDLIVAVDGKPVAGMDIDEIVQMIRGEPDTAVSLSIERTAPDGTTSQKDYRLVRAFVDLPTVESRILEGPDKIGYVYLYQFNEKASDMLKEHLAELKRKGVKALVFDVRDNPGGLLTQAIDVAGEFLDGKSVVIVRERDGNEQTLYARRDQYEEMDIPLVMLVNGNSASASEIVAGALRDHDRALLVGERTFGKGLVQTLVNLGDGSAIAITTARYYTPKHVDINPRRTPDGEVTGGGLKPDYEVEQNPDFEFGEDATDWQLKKAVEVLRTQLQTGD